MVYNVIIPRPEDHACAYSFATAQYSNVYLIIALIPSMMRIYMTVKMSLGYLHLTTWVIN